MSEPEASVDDWKRRHPGVYTSSLLDAEIVKVGPRCWRWYLNGFGGGRAETLAGAKECAFQASP